MTPREFFDQIASKNAQCAIDNPGDPRHAINAIMTLDAFFGVLHAMLHSNGVIQEKDDDAWKETVACESDEYRLLRDTAYALKHGQLTGKKPRFVRRPDQIVRMPAAFNPAVFQRNAFQTQARIWIDAPDNDYRADEVIKAVSELAYDLLSEHSL